MDGLWMLCKVDQLLTTQYPDFDCHIYGHSKLSGLIAASSWFALGRLTRGDQRA